MPFHTGLVIWSYDIHSTPSVQPNAFMGGVVMMLGALQGTTRKAVHLTLRFQKVQEKKDSQSPSLQPRGVPHPEGCTLACFQTPSSPSHCVSLMIVVVLAGATLEDWASLVSPGHGANNPLPRWDGTSIHGCKEDGVVGTPRNSTTFDRGEPYSACRATIPAGCRVPPPQIHPGLHSSALLCKSSRSQEFCNLVQCRLHQCHDWKIADPLQDAVDAFGGVFRHVDMQKTLWPSGGCQPVPGLSRAASNPSPQLDIKHTLISFVTCSRSLNKNHDHANSVSPSTSANATGTMFLFSSYFIAINSECLYLPYKNNDAAVPGMACCIASIQPINLSYEATQLPYTWATAFCFPRHAFLYEMVKPRAFFTVSTTSDMGMSDFFCNQVCYYPHYHVRIELRVVLRDCGGCTAVGAAVSGNHPQLKVHPVTCSNPPSATRGMLQTLALDEFFS
ncbi:hypothetical protein G2W53_009603 [Senna tora]|uniref:Uncharacterized protein n=1 Tax=Senna tora TaxID=362788 RepID=A0A834WY74_9FABA|nr:hypothetical protein G2W53_009603 [Senna tora]